MHHSKEINVMRGIKGIVLLVFLATVFLVANSEVGCNAIIDEEPVGCSTDNILHDTQKSILENSNELSTSKDNNTQSMYITEKILSVEVMHDDHTVLIERTSLNNIKSCPPFCIEPLTIKDVITVGELETLAFIEKLKEKKGKLLIDVRENKVYKFKTIPGAINLPSYMLKDKSLYQEDVLKLLGAKKKLGNKSKNKWYFKEAYSLLIFGQSATYNDASTVIKKLLTLGYPHSKIFYYRGGIESWNAMGLTLI